MSRRRPPHRTPHNRPTTRPARPAQVGAGRISAHPKLRDQPCGQICRLEIDGRARTVLVEASADIAGWDLGDWSGGDLPALLGQRLDQAREFRRRVVPADVDVYRLVHDAGDQVAGLVVDVYGNCALAQTYGHAFASHADTLASLLNARFSSARLVERARHGARAAALDRWVGAAQGERVVHEHGLRFSVRLDGDVLGTGLFADQRPQRRRVRQLASGRRVLNLFAYAGGFTVAAAVGGASAVDHVDLSRACMRWGAYNLALNSVSPSRHRMIQEDARDFVDRARRQGQRYGLVIVDPPSFATGSRAFALRRDLGPLLQGCIPLLDPGGLLLVSCNQRGLTSDWTAHCALQAARDCGRELSLIEQGGQGPDHPWPSPNDPLRHLSCAWLRVI